MNTKKFRIIWLLVILLLSILVISADWPSTSAQEESEFYNCFSVKVVGGDFIKEGGLQTIEYWFKVTNHCKWNVGYVAISNRATTRVAPLGNWEGALGDYLVKWTTDNGKPGFSSWKFMTLFNDGFNYGASEVFPIRFTSYVNSHDFLVQAHAGASWETFIGLRADITCITSYPCPAGWISPTCTTCYPVD